MILDPEDFNPRLLSCYLFLQDMAMAKGRRLEERLVVDYEIEYILESAGAQMIDGRVYPVMAGDLVFRRPGSITQGIMPYSCYCAVFDLAGARLPRPAHYQAIFMPRSEWKGRWPLQPNYPSTFLESLPHVFHPSSGEVFKNAFDLMLKRSASPVEGSALIVKSSLLRVLYEAHAESMDPFKEASSPGAGDERGSKIRSSLAFMRANLGRKLSLAEIAAEASYSPSHFHRLFTELVGTSPLEKLTAMRLEAAKELLASTELTAESIARECGFENTPYFFTLFKRLTGETPSGFRKRHRY